MPVPKEILVTYTVAIIVLLLFAAFITFFVILYKKRQSAMILEQQLKDAEYQNKLLAKEIEKNKIVQKERERISRDLHDDIGADLSSIKILTEYMQQKYPEPNLAQDLNKILVKSKEVASSMREMVWSLNPRFDTVESIVHYTKQYAVGFFKNTRIKLKVDIPEQIPMVPIGTSTRRNIFLTIKEALNNIVKHSEASTSTLEIDIQGHLLIIKIIDNGKGIEKDQVHGNGLYIMPKRIHEINGQFEINSDDQGTTIIIQYPMLC